MVKNFWKTVNEVINTSDILLIILDARLYNETRNIEIETKIKRKGKRFLYVLNKSDLLTDKETREIKLTPSVMMSAKKHIGNMRLLRQLSRMSAGKPITVGILGYPNTGKSSVINAMKGRQAAGVSSVSGYTTGFQKIKVTRNITLIDTPGVFPYKERDEIKHSLIAAKDPNKLKDPESVVMELMKRLKGKIEKHYNVEKDDDYEEVLENIALKKKVLKKGGKPDTRAMAVQIIFSWQKGRIK